MPRSALIKIFSLLIGRMFSNPLSILLDNSGNLIAIAKTNRTYYKPTDDIVVFNLTIDY